MNDTLTRTLSDLPKYEQDFAKAITGYVDAKYKEYKRQEVDLQASPVPLENIHFGPDDFKNFLGLTQNDQISPIFTGFGAVRNRTYRGSA